MCITSTFPPGKREVVQAPGYRDGKPRGQGMGTETSENNSIYPVTRAAS